MSLFLNSELDSVDARIENPTNPELMENWTIASKLPQNLRMLWESEDWRITVKKINGKFIATRVVRKRNPLYQEHGTRMKVCPLLEHVLGKTEPDPEDAMAHIGGGISEEGEVFEFENPDDRPPPDTWDLVFAIWKEYDPSQQAMVWRNYSADHFVSPNLHHLNKFQQGLEKRIKRERMPGQLLFKIVKRGIEQGLLSRGQARRIWDLWRQEEFIRNKK